MTAFWLAHLCTIYAALLLNLLLGNPPHPLHPERLAGAFARLLARPLAGGDRMRRGQRGRLRLAGAVVTLLVLLAVAAAAYGLLEWCAAFGFWPRFAAGTLLLACCLYRRELRRDALRVHACLQAGDLPQARQRLSLLLGREVDELNERQLIRATVEGTAVSAGDALFGPVFFCVLGGPALAVTYRVLLALHQQWSQLSGRAAEFGWCAAQCEEYANYFPARFGAVLLALATLVRRRGEHFFSPRRALDVIARDAVFHPLPNAGWLTAAAAGALGVQLGGTHYFGPDLPGIPSIGDAVRTLHRDDIARVNYLVSGGLFLLCLLLLGGLWLVKNHIEVTYMTRPVSSL